MRRCELGPLILWMRHKYGELSVALEHSIAAWSVQWPLLLQQGSPCSPCWAGTMFPACPRQYSSGPQCGPVNRTKEVEVVSL